VADKFQETLFQKRLQLALDRQKEFNDFRRKNDEARWERERLWYWRGLLGLGLFCLFLLLLIFTR
jgi:hypothetical protein